MHIEQENRLAALAFAMSEYELPPVTPERVMPIPESAAITRRVSEELTALRQSSGIVDTLNANTDTILSHPASVPNILNIAGQESVGAVSGLAMIGGGMWFTRWWLKNTFSFAGTGASSDSSS